MQISDNGNLLFYNTPASSSYQGKQYTVYLSNQGEIIMSAIKGGRVVKETIIHSYKNTIDWKRGKADDHAAPSIIADIKNYRLIIATSYHGSPMHIYEYNINNKKHSKITELAGRYTYPRLFKSSGDIYLLARIQPEGVLSGDLVLRQASNNFNQENIVIPSKAGEVVYAGSPAVTKDGFMVTYSMHSYQENRLIGFNLAKYSFDKQQLVEECKLNYLLGQKSHSNRPTGLGYDGETIMVATAYTEKKNTHRTVKFDNFKRENTVVVAKGKKCKDFNIIEKRTVEMPYYHTSIAVDNSLNFLYFDNNRYHSNMNSSVCFGEKRMLYPQFTHEGVIYAAMEEPYSIRDFKNSLFLCNF